MKITAAGRPRLRNDLYCVEWDVKLYYIIPFKSQPGLLRIKVFHQTSIPPGSVNEYQLRLGRQRQVWFIPIADDRVGVPVKL